MPRPWVLSGTAVRSPLCAGVCQHCRVRPSAPPFIGYQSLALEGVVGVSGNVIAWRPSANTATVLPNLPALKREADRGILVHLTLKGNFIWALDDPTLFLDGDTFGVQSST